MSRKLPHINRVCIQFSEILGLISKQKYSSNVLVYGYRFPSQYLQWIYNHHYNHTYHRHQF